jgi:murein DD-endopeptidase MepM/ murein hydrolase activator NlpD
MEKRSILLVPPRGTRMKILRVPFWAVFALAVMAAAGIAGYFVPLDRLIFTEQELAQKRSLVEQNERLQNNIGTTLRMLSNLNERTDRLQAYKDQHKDIIGLPLKPPPQAAPRRTPSAALSSSAALRHIGESEKLMAKFVASMGEGGRNLFDTVPVARPIPPSESAVSRLYGMDRDPFTGKQMMHYGVDFAAVVGTPVAATASGVVASVENDPIWGRRVTISHGRGFKTVYAHLGTIRAAQGRPVDRGEVIGTVGMSGLTTGSHVHYEIWHKDRQVNPEEYFFPAAAAGN